MSRKSDSSTLSLWPAWCWVAIFAVAFAWVESAVVVYLRHIYFDGGFSFPLTIEWQNGEHVIDPLVRIEFFREVATMIMLGAAGVLAGTNRQQRFAFFVIAFGLWDIFYYVWLFVMVGWPESLMTWDLLFYVPLPWVGPVITPVLIAALMTVFGTIAVHLANRGIRLRWRWYDLLVGTLLALALITAFCWDWRNILQVPGDPVRTGVPSAFAWWLYGPALAASVAYFGRRLMVLARAGRPQRILTFMS